MESILLFEKIVKDNGSDTLIQDLEDVMLALVQSKTFDNDRVFEIYYTILLLKDAIGGKER